MFSTYIPEYEKSVDKHGTIEHEMVAVNRRLDKITHGKLTNTVNCLMSHMV